MSKAEVPELCNREYEHGGHAYWRPGVTGRSFTCPGRTDPTPAPPAEPVLGEDWAWTTLDDRAWDELKYRLGDYFGERDDSDEVAGAIMDGLDPIAAALVAAAEQRGAAAERERIARQSLDRRDLMPASSRGAVVTASPGATDPIVIAVAEALRERGADWWQTPPRMELAASVAVEAHRRAVLDQRDVVLADQMRRERDDRRAERDGLAREMYQVEQILGRALGYPPYPADWGAPDGDVCVGEHVPESLATEAAAKLASLPEWRCPGCGAVTRARMADHPTDAE